MNRPKLADVAELRSRLAADEWLSPAEIGRLFSVTRWAVIGWMKADKIGYKKSPTGHRTGNPADVRKLLADADVEHRGGTPTTP